MNEYIKQIPDWTKKAIATFGNGCFWCTEAIFRMVDGVIEVNSGYSGGHTPTPIMNRSVPAPPGMRNAYRSFLTPAN